MHAGSLSFLGGLPLFGGALKGNRKESQPKSILVGSILFTKRHTGWALFLSVKIYQKNLATAKRGPFRGDILPMDIQTPMEDPLMPR